MGEADVSLAEATRKQTGISRPSRGPVMVPVFNSTRVTASFPGMTHWITPSIMPGMWPGGCQSGASACRKTAGIIPGLLSGPAMPLAYDEYDCVQSFGISLPQIRYTHDNPGLTILFCHIFEEIKQALDPRHSSRALFYKG